MPPKQKDVFQVGDTVSIKAQQFGGEYAKRVALHRHKSTAAAHSITVEGTVKVVPEEEGGNLLVHFSSQHSKDWPADMEVRPEQCSILSLGKRSRGRPRKRPAEATAEQPQAQATREQPARRCLMLREPEVAAVEPTVLNEVSEDECKDGPEEEEEPPTEELAWSKHTLQNMPVSVLTAVPRPGRCTLGPHIPCF